MSCVRTPRLYTHDTLSADVLRRPLFGAVYSVLCISVKVVKRTCDKLTCPLKVLGSSSYLLDAIRDALFSPSHFALASSFPSSSLSTHQNTIAAFFLLGFSDSSLKQFIEVFV